MLKIIITNSGICDNERKQGYKDTVENISRRLFLYKILNKETVLKNIELEKTCIILNIETDTLTETEKEWLNDLDNEYSIDGAYIETNNKEVLFYTDYYKECF